MAVAMIAGIAVGDNWRFALLAALAAGAIALTRIRYAPVAAVALLAITVVFAQTGYSPGADRRHAPARPSQR